VGARIWNLNRSSDPRDEGFGREWGSAARALGKGPKTGASRRQITRLEDVHKLRICTTTARLVFQRHSTPATLEKLGLAELAQTL
jgi:plasmid stabilization system protein ParE